MQFHQKYPPVKVLLAYGIMMLFTLIVTLASIWTFTFAIAPFFKGLTSILVFLTIPLLYLGVLVYSNKKIKQFYNFVDKKHQYKLDVIKHILLYIVIMLMLFFFFLLSLYFPLEKQGLNNEPLSFDIQPYLFENQFYLYSNENFSKAKEIYSTYNLTFSILEPKIINQTMNENYTKSIFTQNCTIIDELFNLTNYQDEKTIKLILVEFNSSTKGMAHICGKGNLAIVTLNNSMSGWVLAHELGHVLGAEKECWRFNLMKEYSRECYGANWITHDFIRDLQPDFLNQKQIDVIVNSIKTRFT
jgi:hypothetical protein